jgi:hypothetical protein
MTKQLTIRRQADIEACLAKIQTSAELAKARVQQLAAAMKNPSDFLYQLKFEEMGCDPLNLSRKLNLIEQLNQTFTYIASFKAAEYLLQSHPPFSVLRLNLGTTSGWDIQSTENGGLVAEVFAAVNPRNNRKLEKDIEKVAKEKAKHRYVFFMCPGIGAGPYHEIPVPPGIDVVSVGCEMQALTRR